MKAEDLVGLLVPVTFVGFLVIERVFPRRTYPTIRYWNLIGFGCLIMIGVLTTALPMLVPASLASHHLFNGARLGLVGGVLVALIEAGWSAYFEIGYRDVVVYSLLIVVFVLRPGGLFGFSGPQPREV